MSNTTISERRECLEMAMKLLNPSYGQEQATPEQVISAAKLFESYLAAVSNETEPEAS